MSGTLKMKHIAILLAFLMTLSAPVVAQDFEKGLAAYDAGDYATALQEWKPLTEARNKAAQYNLALMYNNGRGVPLIRVRREPYRLGK